MGNWITYAAVASWCAAAYMLPLVAALVWIRRRNDKEPVIQTLDVEDINPIG